MNNQLEKVKTVSFLGLGVMGYPMAGHLAKQFARSHANTQIETNQTQTNNNSVKNTDNAQQKNIANFIPVIKVYNRTISKAKKWVKEYEAELKTICPSLEIIIAEAIPDAAASVVGICVGGDPDLREIVFGKEGDGGKHEEKNGLISNLPSGALIIDHTTASAQVAREIAEACRVKNIGFVDAPISGGQIGAEQGTLAIMCGGSEIHFKQALPVMESYGKKIVAIGPVGSGQTAKMINQLCISGLLQGLAEGLAFGKKAGLNMDQVLEVISSGAASSWQMQHRSHTMLEGRYDFGFAVKWMIKDLKIALEEGKRIGAHTEMTAAILKRYEIIAKQGGQLFDTSSLMTLTDK